MNAPIRSAKGFRDHLRVEANSVLSDPVFKRSPVISTLLRYLVERALSGDPAPSQYEIAVDALGKDEDFDLANDSYPRVQISRLRSSLDKYYALNKPVDRLRIALAQGEYRLDLVMPNGPQARSDDSNAAQIDQRSPTILPPDTKAPSVGRLLSSRWLAAGLVFLIALTTAVIAAFQFPLGSEPQSTTVPGRPAVEFRPAVTAGRKGDEQFANDIEMATRAAKTQLDSSMISYSLMQPGSGSADYVVSLDFITTSDGDLDAYLRLMKDDGEPLFYDVISFDPRNRAAFERDIRAAITYMTSPVGAIASDQLIGIGQEPRSSYACFVLIENHRSDGKSISKLLDQCLNDFPDGDYSAYLFARRAYQYYQSELQRGGTIKRSGPGWTDVKRALELDRYNPFANFTAAKIELANDNCDGARIHVQQSLEKGMTYPAMIAAVEAEATSCGIVEAASRDEIRSMIESNPAPDALLHLYLLIAALSTGDIESAEVLNGRPRVEGVAGLEEELIANIEKAMSDPSFARTQAEDIRAKARIFIWSDKAVDNVLRTLWTSNDRVRSPGGTGTRDAVR